jgi:hypothetical protein
MFVPPGAKDTVATELRSEASEVTEVLAPGESFSREEESCEDR